MTSGPTLTTGRDVIDATTVDPDQNGAPNTTELRNVTVLFADVVQSSQAVLALDPEEARTYLDRIVEAMLVGVKKYGGAICALQGDGVMAVFGTPSATEDHALRACLAAMAIRDAFTDFPSPSGVAPTKVRIGLHSGGALTRPTESGAVDTFDAAGAVVHMASKIERMCPHGAVAASAVTIKLVRGYVRSQPIGALALSADAYPIQVEELLEVSPDYHLEHYFSRRPLSPLVGRGRELQVLTDAIESTAARLTVVGIVGEAGMGKSRLCFEARSAAGRAGLRVVEIRGISLNSATPFAPLRTFLSDLLLLGEVDLERHLATHLAELGLDQTETAAVMAIFNLTRPDSAWHKISGDARQKATIDGTCKIVSAMARRRPLLLIVEDLHDLDDETAACLRRAAGMLADTRFCMITSSRPEGGETLGIEGGRILKLGALQRQDAWRLVQNELRGADPILRQPSSGVIESVLERANGNPFMLEELFRGLTSQDGRGIGGVPMSVEILIRARVDKLPADARRLLHCASALGMRFSAASLGRIAGADALQFEKTLRVLVNERFLVADAGMSVEFTHQITRLACYEGIANKARAALHKQILQVAEDDGLSQMFSLEALADHAYRAGEKERALDFLWNACRESIGHSAVQSVVELRRRALVICAELGPAANMREVDFNLLTFDAINQLSDLHDLVAPLERALTVAEEADARRKVCQVTAHLATTYLVIGRYKQAFVCAGRAVAAAKAAGDLPLVTYAQYILGWAEFHRGHIENAIRLEQELSEQLSGRLETARFGAIGVMSVRVRAFTSWFLTDLGRFADAAHEAAEAARVADAMRQPLSQLLADMAVGYCLFRRGRLDEACDVLEKAYGICRSGAILGLDGFISGWFASALASTGRDEEAGRIVQRVIDQDLGRFCCVAGTYYTYDAKARLLARAGRGAEAMRALEHGVAAMRSTRDSPHYAYGLFSRGELKRALGIEAETAETDFRWALRRARRLGMRPLAVECERALNADG